MCPCFTPRSSRRTRSKISGKRFESSSCPSWWTEIKYAPPRRGDRGRLRYVRIDEFVAIAPLLKWAERGGNGALRSRVREINAARILRRAARCRSCPRLRRPQRRYNHLAQSDRNQVSAK